MSRHRRLGLARSLIIYYAQPWRTWALRRFCRQLIVPGSLVFDVGAHVGHRSVAMAAAGARVVAVEPQPALADFMARYVVDGTRVVLVREAVGATPGQARLHISSRHPTVSSLSNDWIARVGSSAGFAGVEWDSSLDVPVTTLDALIAEHGTPAFCKIDVEGLEAEILAGLSVPLDCIAFECLPAARQTALACIARLETLAGDYRYNWVRGERHRWARTRWLSADDCRAAIKAMQVNDRGLDIYARRGVPA